ncbi:MAG: redoxin domain-containing protein [Planctomycetes bacterium]|nr:redoxin domain-containing protein [Planctomycetota bacterium]
MKSILSLKFSKILLCCFIVSMLSLQPQSTSASETDNDADIQKILKNIPKEFKDDVKRAFGEAEDNATNLIATYKKLKKVEIEGFAFLVGNMSVNDLKNISEEILTEHIQGAYFARESFPWTKSLSKEIFHHYVLPFRSAQEPLEAWRKFFYEEMKPILKKLEDKTLENVALAVNRYCGSKVKFQRTSADDKSPLQTHKRGFGRCEEEMIYFNAVARSVGLPARSVSTPYWPFQDNNHAWCEVYTGVDTRKGAKGWHYLGACEPADKLDKAWFTRVVGRAAFVTSAVMGKLKGENVLTTRDRFTIINSTPVYTETCKLTMEITDANGKPVPEAIIYISVFNFQSLRPILGVRADKNGKFSVDIGIGDYLITSKSSVGTGWAIARSKPGTKVTCKIQYESQHPKGYYWLRYPKPGIKYKKENGHTPDVPVFIEQTTEPDKAVLAFKVTNPISGKIKPVVVCIAPYNKTPWMISRGGKAYNLSGNASLPPFEPGDYVVYCGRRNPNGDVHLYLNRIKLEKGKQVTITIEGDLPMEEGGALPVVREIKEFPENVLKATDGKEYKFDEMMGESGVVLVFFSLENEPSQRMLPKIKALLADAEKAKYKVVGIHVYDKGIKKLDKKASAKDMNLPLMLMDDPATPWAEVFKLPFDEVEKKFSNLPAVIVINKKKKITLWQEGYDLNINAKIKSAISR